MRAFSGIQPSGIIHIGNYFGAIKNWISLQNQYDCIFCIVNNHAITLPRDPKELRENTYKVASIYLAFGIDPKKSIVFVQSEVKEHTELAWILNTITKISELERMTQFKEKAQQNKVAVNVGLFDYPVLMAADILLYQTDIVPVGQDQKQHVELTQILAKRFNRIFGKTFKIPKALIKKEGGKIMGLDDPLKKMSKSANSPLNYIALDDPPEIISDKIKKAVTDSGKEIKKSPQKPAISNLLEIYSLVTNKKIKEIEKDFNGKGYKEFKESLAEALIEFLKPFQKKQKAILKDKSYIEKVLKDGKERAEVIARKTMTEVKNKVGLI
ncbi:MAG TPA: tryptophan--tRNA ligase [Candidatus Pacearchaeota archaeon]|nr:tryptophan--tRNA ligase [Candidatus Pacearchaeota archaeon]HOK94336.1 tryptophan--tRNA ligase [Candidatus Pacearchaeota archaeon]HPO75287.1 tryptophan--tRNA ligase [Candidatus Pacearchaeota archaeon]